MSGDRFRGRSAERRREAVREIREELERIRRSEARIAEALGSLRAARHRVEELARTIVIEDEGVRDVVREEIYAAERRPGAPGAPRPEDPAAAGSLGSGGEGERDGVPVAGAAPADAPMPTEVEARRSLGRVALATVSVLLVAAAGLLAWQSMRDGDENPPLTITGDTAPSGQLPTASSGEAVASGEGGAAGTAGAAGADRFFERLPEDASQRAAVYDSLWQARSPMLNAMVEQVERETRETAVRRAAAAWRAGNATALQRDLVHSALVQYALRQEMGTTLALDGQLLRNPCRGAACSALLNFWETRGQEYGLPPVPENAPSNAASLRVAENVLVLRTLEGMQLGREADSR